MIEIGNGFLFGFIRLLGPGPLFPARSRGFLRSLNDNRNCGNVLDYVQ